MITYVVAHEDIHADWRASLKSLQGLRREGAEVLVLNLTGENLNAAGDLTDGMEEMRGLTLFQAYHRILPKIAGEYVQFLTTAMSCVKASIAQLQTELCGNGHADLIQTELLYGKAVAAAGKPELIDLSQTEEYAPLAFHRMIFRTDAVRRVGFVSDRQYFAGEETVWKILLQNPVLIADPEIVWKSSCPTHTDTSAYPHAQKKKWYLEGLNVLQNLLQMRKHPVRWLQFSALRVLRLQFMYNVNVKDKHVFSNDLDDYFILCGRLLQQIEDDILIDQEQKNRETFADPLKLCFLRLKYGENLTWTYVPSAEGYTICCQGLPFKEITDQNIVIDVMEAEKDHLRMELSFDGFAENPEVRLKAFLGEEEQQLIDTVRYAQTSYFGRVVHRSRTFRLILPKEKLSTDKKKELCFCSIYKGKRMPHPIVTKRFPAKINSRLKDSYWRYGKNLVFLNADQRRLVFLPYRIWRHAAKEIRLLLQILKESEKVFLTRSVYWLTAPVFRNRHIWITFDKLYKGGDNGEYFYRYAAGRKDGPEVHYLINRKYPDAQRLEKEGYQPLYFGTLKEKLYFLHAELVAATHANIPVFSGISPKGFFMLADLFKADIVCIQHGLAVQQLEHNLNQQYDNLKRFYFASKYEIQNLAQPVYGYDRQEETFRLTGVPRYDGLISQDQRQILIVPTWRAYISMPVSIGNVRPYSPTFRETSYFRIYNRLISDPELSATAKKCGYRLIYLLHPTITSQIGDFTPGEQVEVLSPVGADYEKLLTESSLMITDYSGVQFDFAYMRKPVLYYHPDELPPHYEEGGFFYDTMGFGEICRTHEALAERLKHYMETGCRMEPEYIARADDFFAYADQNSCRRIYEDLLEFRRERSKDS